MTAHVENVPCICGKPECQIPYGLCHCGCGQKTNIATQNHTSQGLVKGTPHRYCKGHGRFKESIYPPVGLCICREPNCQIPHGLCHCGCGENTKISKKTDRLAGIVRNMPKKYIEDHHLSRSRTDFSDAQPFKINGVYCKLIQLTQGLYAIVWESDYDWLSQCVWSASYCKYTRSYYATRSGSRSGDERNEKMHRVIMGLSKGDGLEVDHINTGETLDNRRDNLRIANDSEQQSNQRKSRANTSGYKGVGFHKQSGKWRAYIGVNYKLIHLGVFLTPEEAHAAYCEAAIKYHGAFARFE